VFSDIIKANFIFGLCLFCIFVKNTIYELLMEVFRPVLVARYLISNTFYFVVVTHFPILSQCDGQSPIRFSSSFLLGIMLQGVGNELCDLKVNVLASGLGGRRK